MAVAVNSARIVSSKPQSTGLLPDLCEFGDPAEAAASAGLRYVIDREPGIRRVRHGSGFRYLDPNGVPVRDPKVLARIASLVIPPAWSDVWICARANGHLQATGRDERGRKQYRYHPRWREVRDDAKYGRLASFGRALPLIRERVDQDLRAPGLCRTKVLAAVVQLLEWTLIRVGNEEYARTNASFGLTTLRDKHVSVESNALTFVFRGKSGKQHRIGLRNRRLANIVRRCRELPGQTLFQFLDEEGEPRTIGSEDVNAYLREIAGEEFTAKDFRTWFGTVLAARALIDLGPAESDRERKQRIVDAVDQVAERLGNTRAVCRRCYVHPAIIEAYEDGRLLALAAELPSGQQDDEQLVLELLESAA